MAMYGFNYGNVVALNLRWMRYAKGERGKCRVGLVEALEERSGVLKDFEISAGRLRLRFPERWRLGITPSIGEKARFVFSTGTVFCFEPWPLIARPC